MTDARKRSKKFCRQIRCLWRRTFMLSLIHRCLNHIDGNNFSPQFIFLTDKKRNTIKSYQILLLLFFTIVQIGFARSEEQNVLRIILRTAVYFHITIWYTKIKECALVFRLFSNVFWSPVVIIKLIFIFCQ